METEQARAVDVVMAGAKRIYILIIRVNKLFSILSSRCFLKEIENMYSVFLSSTTAFLVHPNFHSCFYNSIETRYMFSINFLKCNYFVINGIDAPAARVPTAFLVHPNFHSIETRYMINGIDGLLQVNYLKIPPKKTQFLSIC